MGRIVSVDAIIIQCYEVYPSIGKDNRNQDQEVMAKGTLQWSQDGSTSSGNSSMSIIHHLNVTSWV